MPDPVCQLDAGVVELQRAAVVAGGSKDVRKTHCRNVLGVRETCRLGMHPDVFQDGSRVRDASGAPQTVAEVHTHDELWLYAPRCAVGLDGATSVVHDAEVSLEIVERQRGGVIDSDPRLSIEAKTACSSRSQASSAVSASLA